MSIHPSRLWRALAVSMAVVLASCASPAMPDSGSLQPSPTVDVATAYPLSQPGQWFPGRTKPVLVGPRGDGSDLYITVWYPAVKPAGYLGTVATNAEPDRSGAPYPLLLSSTKVASILAPYLVPHGFTWASVDGIDSYARMADQMFSQPQDLLAALDYVASYPPQGLEGLIDADHSGVIGYSFDGYNALALSGARVDPEYYLAQCPNPDALTQPLVARLSAFSCEPAEEWEAFSARAGEALTESDDGLWQPMTDPRIVAAMPMAGEGWWLFGARGLAAVERPILILVASEDELYPENALIFEHLGASERALIRFMGEGHMMIYEGSMVARMAHFATAFFGYHLQGREDLKPYFSEAWVVQHEDLGWGPSDD